MPPATVLVRESFGENLLTPEEGDRLRCLVHDDLAARRDVVLDFTGVRIVASAFFNTAIGRLYEDIPADVLKQHLNVVNLSKMGLFALKHVVENSKKYYENERFREAVDISNSTQES